MEPLIARLNDGPLEGVIDLDDAPLPSLLLVDDEGILVKQLVPGQPEKVADAETEEDAAAHEEANAIAPVLEEPHPSQAVQRLCMFLLRSLSVRFVRVSVCKSYSPPVKL